MYTTAVQRSFIAQHFLIGGDWGRENQPHSHHYVVELQLPSINNAGVAELYITADGVESNRVQLVIE